MEKEREEKSAEGEERKLRGFLELTESKREKNGRPGIGKEMGD